MSEPVSKSIGINSKVRFNVAVMNQKTKERCIKIFGRISRPHKVVDVTPIPKSVQVRICAHSESGLHRPATWVHIHSLQGKFRAVVDTVLIKMA